MSSSTQSPQPTITNKTASAKKRTLTLWVGIGLIGFALLAFFYGGLAWLGFRAGDAEKIQKIAAETENTLARQLELVEQNLAEGNLTLAQRRLDYILSVDGNNSTALVLKDEINQAQILLLTPSPSPTPTAMPTPTSTPLPSPTPDPAEAIATREAAWVTLQADLETLDINEQIQQLEVFRAQYPGMHNRESSQQLYDRYLSYGVDLMRNQNAVERGILLLTKARGLGDLPDDVEGEIFWAEQYAAGISYFEVNWDLYLSYFRPLCEAVPLYQNSCGKLAEGLAPAAAGAFDSGDWCNAATLYIELSTIAPNAELKDGTLQNRLAQSVNACGEPLVIPTVQSSQGELIPTVQSSQGELIPTVPTTAPGAPLPIQVQPTPTR